MHHCNNLCQMTNKLLIGGTSIPKDKVGINEGQIIHVVQCFQ